jgi:hypothetical protein
MKPSDSGSSSPGTCAHAAQSRAVNGISMRWLCRSRAGACICGAPSTARARCRTCLLKTGLCPSGARHRQAALVCLGQARTRLSARREQGLRANNRAENSHQGATTRAQDARLQVARINAAPPPLPRGRPTTPSHSSATPSPVVRSTLSGRKRHARGKSRLPQQKLTLTPADVRPQMRCRDSAPQNAVAYRALYEHYRILAEDPAIRRVMNRLRGGVALRNHETH